MIYLYGYFLTGVFVLVGALVLSRVTESSDAKEFRQALEAIHYEDPDQHKFSKWIFKIMVPILGSSFAILTWPYWLIKKVQEDIWKKSKSIDDEEEKIFTVNVTDLVRRMSVEEIEETERINDPMGAVPDVAFGFLNPMWEKFKTQLELEDEIWTYKTTWKSNWQNQIRFGYAILRGEDVVHQLMTNWEDVRDSSDSN